ncbi:MAG: DOMON-like domain-containing protein [Rhizomicrobium sp.]
MRRALKIHPDSLCDAATQIEVEIWHPRSNHLTLCYVVTGKICDLVLPPLTAPARSDDDLWQHTCFEAFFRSGEMYYEFNFAPSTQWAVYHFNGYRNGKRVANEVGVPLIEVKSSGAILKMLVLLECPRDEAGWLGLSAVIEESGGRKSYWALAHPPGKADFHHSDCFALELPAVEQP